MELNIIPIGNSNGVILPKKLMKKFNLNCYDTLIIQDSSLDLCFKKKEDKKEDMSFFSSLPICKEAYGGDTEKYLEAIEEPEEDDE